MHNEKMFDLGSGSQGHGVQHSQWCYSMANSYLCKSHLATFAIAPIVSYISTLQVVYLDNNIVDKVTDNNIRNNAIRR